VLVGLPATRRRIDHATEQATTPRHVARERADRHSHRALRRVLPQGAELAAYGVLWAALELFLWWRIRTADDLYLDKWLCADAAEFIWEWLPGGAMQAFPGGGSRAPAAVRDADLTVWEPFRTSTAFTISHLVNAVLLSSAVVAAALFGQWVIQALRLRAWAV
jgi:hypothetical protein